MSPGLVYPGLTTGSGFRPLPAPLTLKPNDGCSCYSRIRPLCAGQLAA